MTTRNALNGQWLKILEARHYGDNLDLTPQDLSTIVRLYRSRKQDAPVGVGINWRGARSFGSIVDLRREGSSLSAKIDRATPELEGFYQETQSDPKVAVALSKTPEGLSLQRIGFLREDESAPREKDLLQSLPRQDAFGNTEIVFSEESSFANQLLRSRSAELDGLGVSANQEIQRLKAAGRWHPTFDFHQFPVLFSEYEKSNALVNVEIDGSIKSLPLVQAFSRFVEQIYPAVAFAESIRRGSDSDLHEAAKRLQRAEGISYSDALDLANKDRLRAARTASFTEQSAQSRGVMNRELSEATEQRARDRGLSYADALSEIAQERPELLNR